MKTSHLIIFTCTLWSLTLPATLYSQSSSAKGDKYYNQNLFESAIKYYLVDAKSHTKKVSEYALQKLADCYRITGEFEKAEATYKKILKKKKKEPVNVLNYGLSLKSSAKYAEAVIQFQEYIRLKPEDPMGPIFLMSCDSAQKWLDETLGKEVKNSVKINSELSDFSPVFYSPRKLFFSSSRLGSTEALISFEGGTEMHRLDLYGIDIENIETPQRKTKDVVNFREINTAMHEGPACFSSDGKELYFTKTIKGVKDKSNNSILNTLQVYYSRLDSNGKWSTPGSAFEFNSLDYSVGHPSLSKDGKKIFYMSDKPGGFGKTDIYYSVKENGKWSAPVNAGNIVNTFGFELFPYLASSGELYFSSNAHPGMGQLDIFRAHFENEKWASIANLKPPVNSIGNDFGISFDGNHLRGFFSSDRFNGKGAEDIYSFSDELFMEFSLINDSLQFNDLEVYDDVKYKLTNETDSTNIELHAVNGIFSVPILQNKNYKLIANRYGMKYNQVVISYTKDSLQKNMTFTLRTSERPLQVTGKWFIGVTASPDHNTLKSENTFSPTGNSSFSETEAGISRQGYFTFKAYLEAGQQKVVSSNSTISDKE
ncbi:hypothetical protein CNR22_23105 [Sphingobacteriaceae bacterium]|nr:hypothetical protein CNR22_23105 [Sphingobacteriaceae bacterium]